jgi:hypothetical protein
MAAYSLSVRIRNSDVSSDPHESADGAWSTRVEMAAVCLTGTGYAPVSPRPRRPDAAPSYRPKKLRGSPRPQFLGR